MAAAAQLDSQVGPVRWRARCMSAIGCFVGPSRKTEAAAEIDADRHNRKEHADD